jgi:TolB-like protein
VALKLSLFLAELKRRKVYQVAVAYLAVGVAIALAVPDLFQTFDLPTAAGRFVIVLIALGFPIALVLAWAYDVRPEPPTALPSAGPRVAEPGGRKSIVVLPFDNLSPDPGDAYFADGLTEEIITDLSCCGLLRVISRNSAMALKETRKGTRAIAEELQVQFVLEGSVRKAGSELRVTAQLIDARSDEHVWAERFSGTLDDVFEIQGQLSRSIVDSLRLELTAGEEEALTARPMEDSRAYECYLKARHDLYLSTRESIKNAIRTLENGLELFGESATLLATLGEAYWIQVDLGYETGESHLERAAAYAERTLDLDPASPHGKKLMANLERAQGDLTRASRLMMEAHRADPNDPGILLFAAAFSSWYVGQQSVAVKLFDRLLAIDPLTPMNHLLCAFAHLPQGSYDQALVILRKAQGMGLEFPWIPLWIGYCLGALGRQDEATRGLEDALEEGLPQPTASITRFFLAALEGEREGAMGVLDPKARDFAWKDPDLPGFVAGGLAQVGETEEALRWLRHSLDRGNINHPFFATHDVYLEPLRSDPRFQEMMEEVKPKWEAFHF